MKHPEKEADLSKLNIFIDGSWLFKACAPGLVLASKTENSGQGVRLDFSRLNQALLDHVKKTAPDCDAHGELFLATSLFSLPDDFDKWSERFDYVQPEHIEKMKRNQHARESFVQAALRAGYSEDAIYRPLLKEWIWKRLIEDRYQEKQVDATVVALLVRSAITRPGDYHCVITGDSDILPAIKVAYPQYSENVFVATTHPDELKAEHRQTSFSLGNFAFEIPPFYLQDHLQDIIQGEYVYSCAECHKVFVRSRPIPARARPYCFACMNYRT